MTENSCKLFFLPPEHFCDFHKSCICQLKGSSVFGLQQLGSEVGTNIQYLKEKNYTVESLYNSPHYNMDLNRTQSCGSQINW